jgi:hypothetical protein
MNLKAGWRIRLVAPLNRSGTRQLQSAHAKYIGPTVMVNSGNDLLGYEIAYYARLARVTEYYQRLHQGAN